MIDTTILIDQSYFLQNSENIKTPEEKAKDFTEELLKAKRDSVLLKTFSEEKQHEIFSEFLFKSLSLYSKDSSNLPTGRKLDEFILNEVSVPSDEEEYEEEVEYEEGAEGEPQEGETEGETQAQMGSETQEGEGENVDIPLGPEGEEGAGVGQDSGGSEDGGDDGEDTDELNPFEVEGIERGEEAGQMNLLEGENVTIRRSNSNRGNGFF